ncbi:hypothetical protein Cni_G13052 [Canna indica]|uniref:Uncharacterized protein n=1 Tax=Canna indica TaxID=4628 RepID=A0AAQ3KEK1_9LILI|nr:hypothetical protein Cni_G13052 [Canna indica]
MPKLQRQSHWARVNHKVVRSRRSALAPKMFDAWPQKLLSGFRRILTGFFSPPHRRPRASLQGSAPEGAAAAEAPKRSSCSYYLYPLNAHYEEAITDCIEFLNKSSKDVAVKVNIGSRRSCEDLV